MAKPPKIVGRVVVSAVNIMGVNLRLRHFLTAAVVGLTFVAGWTLAGRASAERNSKVLVMQQRLINVPFYSNSVPARASVILGPTSNGYAGTLEIQFKTEDGTGYKTEALGLAESYQDAVERWGFMDWREDGVHVGKGSNSVFMSKRDLESGWR